MRPGFALPLIVLVASAVLAIPVIDQLRGAAFVTRAAGLHGPWPDRLAALDAGGLTVADMPIPSRYGSLRGRLYRPARPFSRTIVLTPGVHMDGIDETRLVDFAREFARTGLAVVTPELPDLVNYEVTPREPDLLEDTARWAAARRDLAPDRRVGFVGISFSGGLSVVAAGRASMRERIAFTLSFGGHGDLPRTLRYLCTGLEADGSRRPPHDYGVVVILLNAADLVVPPAQAGPLRHAVRTFLRASSLDMYDKARARETFAAARHEGAALPEPARSLMAAVNGRDVRALGDVLLPYVERYAGDPALSAERSPAPPTPVFLLHGADDNVIPAIESTLLARSLAARGTPVRQLSTPLITHAEVDRPGGFGPIRDVITFWADVLRR